MSSTSIAAYPGAHAQACVDFIRAHHPAWPVTLNPPRFDYDATVQVFESPTATLVWLRSLQIDPFLLYKDLAPHLHTSWLHLMFQEHIVWEYNLHDEKNTLLDRFEPLPQMWGHETPQIGNAETLASLFHINPARIKRYLKAWDKRLTKRKAYLCRDEYRYGQFEQGYDFLTALTGIRFPQ